MNAIKKIFPAIALVGALAFTTAQAQQNPNPITADTRSSGVQVPIPQTAAEVPGPAAGPMTKASVQMMGRMAYVWGWPLVYVDNQRTALTKAPKTALVAGVMPVGPMNQVVMLTNYVDPREKFIPIPNQDVVYGLGWLSLAEEPVVLQVPDFGDRFWTFPVYDARTSESASLGCNTGPSPVSTWWWGRTGKAQPRTALPASCARPPTSR